MKKVKAIKLLTLCVVMMMAFVGAFLTIANGEKQVKAIAEYNTYGLKVEDSASMRTNVDSMGIRFTGSIRAESTSDVLTISDGNATLLDGARIGMIVAPAQAFDLTSASVTEIIEEHKTEEGQVNYYTLINKAYNMPVNGYAVEFDQSRIVVNADGSVTVKGAIVNLRDNNLKYGYKAVLYKVVDGKYYYSEVSTDTYQLKDLADEFLRSGYEIDEDVIPDLKMIIAKSVAIESTGTTVGIVENPDGTISTPAVAYDEASLLIGKPMAINEIVKANEEDTIEYESATGAVTYDDSAKTLTATGEGSANVKVTTPYGLTHTYIISNEHLLEILDNNISDYKVLYDEVSTMHPSKLYCSYGEQSVAYKFCSEFTKVTGYNLSYTSYMPTTYSEQQKYIVIGNNSYCDLAFADVEGYEYFDDYIDNKYTSYKIIVKGNSIFIQGHEGALRFGIFGLLNKLLGYEKIANYAIAAGLKRNILEEEIFFTYDGSGEVALGVSQIEEEYTMDFSYMQGFMGGNVYSYAEGARLFGLSSMNMVFGHDVSYGYGVHSSLDYFPVETYFADYPNWYSNVLSDGNPLQVCYNALRNDSFAIEVTINAIETKKNEMEKEYDDDGNKIGPKGKCTIYFGDEDTGGHCNCSECEGDLGYEYFMFLNEVYDAMCERIYEDGTSLADHIYLGGMVYAKNSLYPPIDGSGNARVVLNPNIKCVFAFNYADYYLGFSDTDIEMLNNWSKCCSSFRFWTYSFRPMYSMFFYDDFTNKQKTYSTLHKYNAEAIMEEGDKGTPAATNFNTLRIYLDARLAEYSGSDLSEAQADEYYNGLINRFFNSYFDVASEYMLNIFNAQRERYGYFYNNWVGGDNIYLNSYCNSQYNSNGGNGAPDNEYNDFLPDEYEDNGNPYNAMGNNIIGGYSSFGFHSLKYYNGYETHGNRYALSMVYSREFFRDLYNQLNLAKLAVENSALSAERKADLINRIELEELGILYQFMFIYEDEFAKNSSFTSSLSASDLAAIGINSVVEGQYKFLTLCDEFDYNSVGYETTARLKTMWGLSDGIIGDSEDW